MIKAAEEGAGAAIPAFTMGDRLRKAREKTGMTTRDFALELGVSQSTITNAENERSKTRRITLLMWSQVTGVPVEWLETGECQENA
ncbi:MAG: helix-turn-helix domain-containing protein [Nocardioides sp.]|nr:helix-turn-helix domain-containing protein [Nocardioides sp.]